MYVQFLILFYDLCLLYSVTSCLAVLFGYIIVGTLAFSNWEGWSYLDGAYFCFISLMTVGFGDFVPGDRLVDAKWTLTAL